MALAAGALGAPTAAWAGQASDMSDRGVASRSAQSTGAQHATSASSDDSFGWREGTIIAALVATGSAAVAGIALQRRGRLAGS